MKKAAIKKRSILVDYHRALSSMLKDVQTAIEDVRYGLADGEIIHAIDFTEVQAFVVPAEHSGWLSVIGSQDTAEQTAVDLATLDTLFFGVPGADDPPAVLLLPPHRFELKHSEEFFQANALVLFRKLVTKAQEELENLDSDDDFDGMVGHFFAAITDEDRKQAEQNLIGYIIENASNLFLIVSGERNKSGPERLREFLEKSKIIDMADVIGRNVAPNELDTALINRLHGRIYEIRKNRYAKESSDATLIDAIGKRSRRDAIAVAYTLYLNDIILSLPDKKKRRLVLITRSGSLIQAVREYGEEYIMPRLSNMLRYPSAYSPVIRQPNLSLNEQLEDLLQKRRSLNLAQTARSTREAESDADLPDFIRGLHEAWRAAVNLNVAAMDWRSQVTGSRLSSLLSVLRDRHHLQAAISHEAAKLVEQIDLANSKISQFDAISSKESSLIAVIETSRKDWNRRRPAFVWGGDHSTVIGLYFYHSLVTKSFSTGADGARTLRMFLASKMRNRIRPSSSEDLADDAVVLESEPYLVESCLASSFLEAISNKPGKWVTAKIYAEMAVNWRSSSDSTPRHEAYFMRALCRRRADGPSASNIKACFDDLSHAEAILKTQVNEEDARVLLERGVCHFSLWEHVDLVGHADIIPSKGLLTDNYHNAVRLFDRAFNVVEARHAGLSTDPGGSVTRQLLDIVNARCYARISGGIFDEKSFRLTTDLRRLIHSCGWNDSTVPVGQLDTLVWASFLLRRFLPDDNWLQYSARLLADRTITLDWPWEDQALVVRHLSYIDGAMGLGLDLERFEKAKRHSRQA